MKLIDFLNNSSNTLYNFQKNYIDLIKTEKYSKQIIQINLNYTDKIIDIIKDIIKKRTEIDNDFEPYNLIILSINPDCDFPPPKMDIFKYQDLLLNSKNDNENQKKQLELETMPYLDKINIDKINEIPSEIKHIFCHALGYNNPRYNMIPLGRDFRNNEFFSHIDTLPRSNKNIICYYNCTLPPNKIHWYGMIRKHIYDMIINKKINFITIEYCTSGPRIFNKNNILNYYKKILASKFMICPRGCGLDSYRIWDCIYLGCIPIVEKYQGYQHFDDLPILFIDHWKEIGNLTEEYLNSKWNEMIHTDYNYNKLDLSYWEQNIISKVKI